jgi:large subunit ribosomal protein L4
MYRGAMSALLSELARLERLTVVESLSLEAPKTRLLAARLKELGLENVLILVEAYDEKLDLASRNLMGVSVVPVSAIDPVSLIRHERVLATVGAVRMLEEKLA